MKTIRILFFMLLSPILWIFAFNVSRYADILQIETAYYDISFDTSISCFRGKQDLISFFKDYYAVPVRNINATCLINNDINITKNIEVTMKTYLYKFERYEYNSSDFNTKISNNILYSYSYSREPVQFNFTNPIYSTD